MTGCNTSLWYCMSVRPVYPTKRRPVSVSVCSKWHHSHSSAKFISIASMDLQRSPILGLIPFLMSSLVSVQRISRATSQVPNISNLVISNILCWRLTHRVCSSILESLTVRMMIRGRSGHLSPHTRLLAGLHACEINQWVRCWRRLPTISRNSMADFEEPVSYCLCYTIYPYVCRCRR